MITLFLMILHRAFMFLGGPGVSGRGGSEDSFMYSVVPEERELIWVLEFRGETKVAGDENSWGKIITFAKTHRQAGYLHSRRETKEKIQDIIDANKWITNKKRCG